MEERKTELENESHNEIQKIKNDFNGLLINYEQENKQNKQTVESQKEKLFQLKHQQIQMEEQLKSKNTELVQI